MMTSQALLIQTRDLIADPSRWCRGAMARTANWVPERPEREGCRALDPRATRRCLTGALYFVSKDLVPAGRHFLDDPAYIGAFNALREACGALYGITGMCIGIVGVNDRYGHAAVLAVLDSAIRGSR